MNGDEGYKSFLPILVVLILIISSWYTVYVTQEFIEVFFYIFLLPGLLLPYAILYRWKKSQLISSIFAALICGVLYPLLVFAISPYFLYIIEDIEIKNGYVNMTIYMLLALMPGAVIAFLGVLIHRGFQFLLQETC